MPGGWTPAAAVARVRGVIGPALQASAGAALAWYFAHDVLGHRQPFFAPIAAAVALSTSHVQRARRTVQMIAGVLLGIAVGELLHPLTGGGALAVGAVVLVTFVLVVALSVGFVGEGMMFFNQAAASAILVLTLNRSGTGTERALDALVGGGMALLIGVGLFPASPLKLLWDAERDVLESLLGILGRCVVLAQPGRDSERDAEWALAASHGVHARLASLKKARMTARASVRVAPRRILMRGEIDAEEVRVASMNLLTGAVLSLLRTMIDVREYSDMPATACIAEIGALSEVLGLLIAAAQPWPEGTVAEARGRIDALLVGPAPREPPESVLLAVSSRRVARDLLRLLPGERGHGATV